MLGSAESLASVVDVQPGPGDTVWVLNSLEPYFVAFSPEGEVVRAWGKRGGGPGEVQFPNGLVRGPDGAVWLYDERRMVLTRVSAPEGQRTEVLLPDTLRQLRRISFELAGMGGGRPWLRGASDGFAMAIVRDEGGEVAQLYRAEIVVVRSGDGSARSHIALADRLDEPSARYGDADLFVPFPVWDLCADGRFVLYDPIHNTLRRFTPTGAEEAPITLPPERRLETAPDRIWSMSVRRMMHLVPASERPDTVQMRKEFDSQLQQMLPQFSDVFPEYADLHCADAYWLQPFDLERGLIGRGPGWLRVDEDGTTRAFELPDRFTPYRFTGARVWGVLLDDLDIPSIAWIDLGGRDAEKGMGR